jgi:hypothetical protein
MFFAAPRDIDHRAGSNVVKTASLHPEETPPEVYFSANAR